MLPRPLLVIDMTVITPVTINSLTRNTTSISSIAIVCTEPARNTGLDGLLLRPSKQMSLAMRLVVQLTTRALFAPASLAIRPAPQPKPNQTALAIQPATEGRRIRRTRSQQCQQPGRR